MPRDALGLELRAPNAADHNVERHPPPGVRLRIEEHLDVAHVLRMRLGEVGEGQVEEIRLMDENPHALVINFEKGGQVVEIVGCSHLRRIFVRERHAIPFCELEFHFGLERALDMHMQFALRHAGDEAPQIAHDYLLSVGLSPRIADHYSVSGIGVALPSASANCGMCPRPRTRLGIGAERFLPIVAFGQDHACPDDVGAGRAHQRERRGKAGAGRHDIVDHRDPPLREQRHGAAIEHQALLAGGRHRLHFLHERVGQMDLRRFLGDDILVEAERARDFDNDRDAKRRGADDDVGLERAELGGKRLADALAELHPHIDHHQQRDGEPLVDRHDRQRHRLAGDIDGIGLHR